MLQAASQSGLTKSDKNNFSDLMDGLVEDIPIGDYCNWERLQWSCRKTKEKKKERWVWQKFMEDIILHKKWFGEASYQWKG